MEMQWKRMMRSCSSTEYILDVRQLLLLIPITVYWLQHVCKKSPVHKKACIAGCIERTHNN